MRSNRRAGEGTGPADDDKCGGRGARAQTPLAHRWDTGAGNVCALLLHDDDRQVVINHMTH